MKKTLSFTFIAVYALSLLCSSCKNDSTNQQTSDSTTQQFNDSTNQQLNTSTNQQIKTITLNNLTWLTQNLNEETPNSWCYDNTPSYCKTYGRLYSWEDANNLCKTLGEGWRLPSVKDWTGLINLYGAMGMPDENQKVSPFKMLLEGGATGFDVVRGGALFPNDRFADLGDQAYFWTSTKSSDYDDTYKAIIFQSSVELIGELNFGAKQGASCRCVRE